MSCHQHIIAWPHTNYTPCTVGTYLHDCGREQGPMGFVRGKPAKWAVHDPRPCLPSPDWTATGYSSLFAKQRG